MSGGDARRSWAIAAGILAILVTAPATAGAQTQPPLIDHGVVDGHAAGGGDLGAARFELWPELKWRGSKTITYFNKADKYKKQVAQAASAWNKSGAKVNWKPVSQSNAKVIIRIDSNLQEPIQGLATTWGTHAVIDLQEDLLTKFPPKQNSQAVARAIIAHEMGHVMGLGHEPRKCATMNAALWSECKQPDETWEYRCRPLEPDDVRGGAKAFGGSPNNLPKPFCALGKEPNAVTDFTATYDDDQGDVILTWGLPAKKPPKDVTIYRGKRDGTCPDAKGNNSNVSFTERAAKERVRDFVDGGGTFCYRAVSRNEYFRPGESVKTSVTIVGNGPAADFEYFQTDGLTVEFEDWSDDPEGDINSWSWDFGDGSGGSTQRNPTHTFPAKGTYQVTLTIGDQGGNSDSVTKPVLVAVGEPPDAYFYYEQTTGTTVEFTDDSYDPDGDIVSWVWDFGDGSAGSTTQHPTHAYEEFGTYDVTLTVADDDGNEVSYTQEVQVLEPGAPLAEFDYWQPDFGDPVEFFDYSWDEDGSIVSWQWDFGDGESSTEPEPAHQYAAPGEYEVTLTVTDDDGKTGSVTYTVYAD